MDTSVVFICFFFFQAEDGIRDLTVTGVQTCALPIFADSVELTMRGHAYDALVGLAGCDKSLPGMMMVMCRLNVPSIFIYGGSILPGRFRGKPVTGQDLFEAGGRPFGGRTLGAALAEVGKRGGPRPRGLPPPSPPHTHAPR